METYQQIVEFISDEFGIDESRITMKTDIQQDLSIYGDDASEFIQLFSIRFNVDVSSFKFDNYFRGEGYDFFEFIGLKSIPSFKKLLISDLVRAVQEGALE